MIRYESLASEIHTIFCEGIPQNFSGLGVVIYRGCFKGLPVSPLLEKSEIEPAIDYDVGIARFLLSISRYSDIQHDGFHFIHELKGLTHLCQFVSPPIPTEYTPKQYGVGARYRSAELTSLMDNICAVLVVERSGNIRAFINGAMTVLKHEA